MIPSWNVVENIWVGPFFGLKVKILDVIVLHFCIPSTIDVDVIVACE